MRKYSACLQEKKIAKKSCEACDQNNLSEVTIGIEIETYGYSIVNLCKNCGAIDGDLMQFCREFVLGCSEN